jgi:hypothetical protein
VKFGLCAVVAAGVALFSFALRSAGVDQIAGRGGAIGPLDDLYHAQRISEAAAHGGRVGAFDPNIGLDGAFCPWPPLYDAAAGLTARAVAGGGAILPVAIWIPPVVTSLFLGFAAGILTRMRIAGPLGGIVFGAAAAMAPAFLDVSKVGDIDHHFLEPPLALGILAATLALGRAENRRQSILRGAALAVAILAALFVQVALLFAAGLALAALILFGGRRDWVFGAALGFAIAAAVVTLYGLSMGPGYPRDEWHLGVPHAAALIGAAVAAAAFGVLSARGAGRLAAALIALAAGGVAATAIPTAAPALLSGSRFFGGDPWLETIDEFRPLFHAGRVGGLTRALMDVGGGAALLAIFAVSSFRASRDSPRTASGAPRILALFAGAYLVATLTSVRFLVLAVVLLALVGALVVAGFGAESRRLRATLAAAVLLLPWGVGALARVLRPEPAVPEEALPIIRSAAAIRAHGGARAGAAILGPWPWGHVYEVFGGARAVVDGFGGALGRTGFENSLGMTFSPREDAVAVYCRSHGIRWIVLENPALGAIAQADAIGLDHAFFVRGQAVTPALRFSFWWRAYFDRGAAVRDGTREAPPLRAFRLVYSDPAGPVGPPGLQGPAVEVWELAGDGHEP